MILLVLFDKFDCYRFFMENEKFIGLKPYQEDADFFYGREKEVEGLLQILQKDKLGHSYWSYRELESPH